MDVQLYQFPISHYCEKARWALDYKRLPHTVHNLVPGLHRRTTTRLGQGTSVPLLLAGEQGAQGSTEIITLLDELVTEKQLTPADASRRGEAMAWEQWLDGELGIDVRLVCYFTLLEHPAIVRRYFSVGEPWWGGLFLRFGYRKLAAMMRERMNINPAAYDKALERIDAALDRLEAAYAERDYLVGQVFTRADLTAAALCGPLIQPAGYGMEWGELPEPLAGVCQRLSPRLEWARRLYRDHRQSSSAHSAQP